MARNRLAASRKYRGLTVQYVAEAVGVTDKRLLAWEQGKGAPSIEQAIRLSITLELPIDFLFYGGEWAKDE